MMIKGVNRIKNFGVFDDYKAVNTAPFTERNIIYGWNYSGKTTFSRLFHCLESKTLHKDYLDASFSLDDGTANQLTNESLHADTRIVRVFNSDFIAKNLSWDGDTFDPILLLGEESIELEKQITEGSARLEKCRGGYKKKIAAVKDIDTEVAEKKKVAASQIKTTLAIVEAFNATHLDKLLDAINLIGMESCLISQHQVPEYLKLALASDKDKLEIVKKVEMTPEFTTVKNECKSLLDKVPTFSSTIDYLRDNPTVANWVEQGLPLHNNAESCEFCGNKLDIHRMDSIRAHFSKDLINYRQDVQGVLEKVSKSRLVYEEKSKGLFYPNLRELAEQANASLKVAVAEYNVELGKLSSALEKKLIAPFDKVEFPQISDLPEAEVKSSVQAVNTVIEKTNEITANYGKEKLAAITSLKNHYAADFAIREKIDNLEKKKNRNLLHQQRYKAVGESIKANVAALEAKINQAQKGREYLNSLIADLLGGHAVQIKVVNDGNNDRFQLVRGDFVATNLSEGEKTAIAFSFFISKLREEKELKDVIVYIDDPISSLDSNHIFQVNSMIREVFLYKDASDGDKWKTSCKQLFISTHNFEFLSLLKELPGQKNRQNYYHVKRISQATSTFINLSEAIIRFPSEYHYLYSLIRDFHNSADKGNIERLLSIPNAVRRFVELYTMARLPSKDEVDVRAEVLFGASKAKRILKVLHYFSHLNNIERLVKNTDLICDIENAVSDLLDLIKADDPRHLAALDTAVS